MPQLGTVWSREEIEVLVEKWAPFEKRLSSMNKDKMPIFKRISRAMRTQGVIREGKAIQKKISWLKMEYRKHARIDVNGSSVVDKPFEPFFWKVKAILEGNFFENSAMIEESSQSSDLTSSHPVLSTDVLASVSVNDNHPSFLYHLPQDVRISIIPEQRKLDTKSAVSIYTQC